MNILITGATGFIGSRLIEALRARDDRVSAITRGGPGAAALARTSVRTIVGDPSRPGAWQRLLNRQDAVINLAGEPVAARWTPARKQRIRDSRVLTTRALVEAIGAAPERPRVLINASAIGYYGFHHDEWLEEDADPGADFLARVVRDWEAEAQRAAEFGVRVVTLRIGVVLGTRGGALKRMLPPFRLGLGGPLGSGDQWLSWIHVDDVVALILYCLEQPVVGAVNTTAPEPVRMRDFARVLGRTLHRPAVLPVPAFVLNLLLGEMSEILLSGQRVRPAAAVNAGYRFRYSRLSPALENLVGRHELPRTRAGATGQ